MFTSERLPGKTKTVVGLQIPTSAMPAPRSSTTLAASPNGTVLWEERNWAGRQIQAQSQEDVALAAGHCEILVLGVVEDLDMELRYWIRQ